MLVCTADDDLHSSPEESVTSTDLNAVMKNEKEREKKYVWKHGSKSPAPCSLWLTTFNLLNPNYLWARDLLPHLGVWFIRHPDTLKGTGHVVSQWLSLCQIQIDMWLPTVIYTFHHVEFILVTPPLKNVRKKRFRKTTKKVSCMLFLCLLGGLEEDLLGD